MPLVLTPKSEPAQLQRRLARLRDRWRGRATLQFAAATTAGLLAVLLALSLLDYGLHLPTLIRAVALVSILIAVDWLLRMGPARAWRGLGSDLEVALRIEKQFPEFNDALASSVQFADPRAGGSAALRWATERRAARSAVDCEFETMLPVRRPVIAGGLAAGLMMVAGLLVVLAPENSAVAAARIFDPFGDHPWPPATLMTLHAPSQLARGDPFLLQGELRGVIPDRVEFRFAIDDVSPTTLALAVTGGDDLGTFGLRLEPNRIPRSFRYQVTGNDAATPWKRVAVLRAPELVPLDGRPSPQVHLEFPRYTRLPPIELPDGGGAIEAVAGATATIRAAVDRPIRAAWLELAEDSPIQPAVTVLPLGDSDPWAVIVRLAATATLASRVPARIESGGQQFELATTPTLSGRYNLRFEDADGLSGRRAVELRVTADPSPHVQLESPAAARESLSLLPEAAIDVRARVDDPIFAIRSIWLEYRAAPDGAVRRLPLMDLRMQPAATATVAHRLELKSLPLDRPLRDGDWLVLAIAADDFDDVTPTKPPGRSHEVELRIVGPTTLAAILQKAQSEIQKELAALHQLQRQARELTESVDAHRRSSGSMSGDDRERLSQASQAQQQIRLRIGEAREGLRGAVDQLRQTLNNNPQPGAQPERERADTVAAELERLAQETLSTIEPMLASARGDHNPTPKDQRSAGPLRDAIRQQSDSERTLRDLAERMGAWSEARELRAEAGLIEHDLERLARQREKLDQQPGLRGARPEELNGEQRAELTRLAEQQAALADRANELAQRLAQKAAEKQAQTAKTADASNQSAESSDAAERLQREAAALARARDRAQGPPSIAGAMQSSANSIAANQQAQAGRQQQAAAEALRDIQSALMEATDPNVDRLAKRLKEAEDAVEQLLEEQERLQKRSTEARAIGDEPQRRTALAELADEQDRLRERADDLAQRLTRWNQESSARELRRAARAMRQARDQIEHGDPADDHQDDALDRLDDASKELSEARQRLDGELQREQRAKSLERLRGFLRRQMEQVAESERLFQAAKSAAGWTRSQQKSLIDLAQSERSLSDELGRFADGTLSGSQVIVHWLKDAARSMTEAGEAIETARAGALDMDTWDDDRRSVQAPQTAAERRLKELIDALQDAEKEQGRQAREQKPSDGAQTNSRGGSGDALPPELQWKLLRMLQMELNERTAAFARDHPDPRKWTPTDRAAIIALQRSQADLSSLLETLSAGDHQPMEPKDGQK